MDATLGWAPVVQGRTLHADFSDYLLAVPGDIWGMRSAGPDSGYAWLRSVVNQAMVGADKMNRRRLLQIGAVPASEVEAGDFAHWILARNKAVCVFGVACMAYDIRPLAELTSRQSGYLGDNIPVFLGYAATVDPAKYPAPFHHPLFPTLDTLRQHGYEAVRPLFKFVADKWDDVRRKASDPPVLTDPSTLPPPTGDRIHDWGPHANAMDVRLIADYATDVDRIRAWSHTDAARIWEAAAGAAGLPVSLCVGAADEQDARRLRFRNAVYRAGGEGSQVLPPEGVELVIERRTRAPLVEPALADAPPPAGGSRHSAEQDAAHDPSRLRQPPSSRQEGAGRGTELSAAAVVGVTLCLGAKVAGAAVFPALAAGVVGSVGAWRCARWMAKKVGDSGDDFQDRTFTPVTSTGPEPTDTTSTALSRAELDHERRS